MDIQIGLNHVTKDNIYIACRVDRAKTIDGLKWYCFECRRYVLPDAKHRIETRPNRPAYNISLDNRSPQEYTTRQH